MIIPVDTGVFSAGLGPEPRPALAPYVARMTGNRVLLTVQTVAELRYGALVAGWGSRRAERLEAALDAVDVVPVDVDLVEWVARLRYECRRRSHPLHEPFHAQDLWIAATAVNLDIPLLSADMIFRDVPRLQLVT